MRIRCKQNAPERMLTVISKSYAFCLSFHWRLSSAARMCSPRQANRARQANFGGMASGQIEQVEHSRQICEAWRATRSSNSIRACKFVRYDERPASSQQEVCKRSHTFINPGPHKVEKSEGEKSWREL